MSHDSQVANAPLRIVFPCHPAERWDNKAHCRRALSQPSRQRPVQPGNLFPHPFYTTCLRQQATTCGEAAHLSPFPFIFSAQRALPQPSRRRHVPPGNFSTTLLHNPPAPAGHNLRRSRAPFPFIFSAQRAPPQPSRQRPVQPGNLFPHPFYITCGEAAPLSPLYSAPEGRLLPL